ncbi:MAG: hypothetical protein ACOX3T_00060 [Bdellovibrionota bacterium]
MIKLKNKDIPRDNIKKLAKRPFSTSLFISTIIVGVYFGTDLPSFIKIIFTSDSFRMWCKSCVLFYRESNLVGYF